ncbi:MAG TPA: hypothetical protein VJQ46_06360, partial [Gemmatimonadales bacterium]|nr:hypothetical protein [Gemmatimonadales bacterium]
MSSATPGCESICRSTARSARLAFVVSLLASPIAAQTPDTLPTAGALKRLSLEQLMDVEVTS